MSFIEYAVNEYPDKLAKPGHKNVSYIAWAYNEDQAKPTKPGHKDMSFIAHADNEDPVSLSSRTLECVLYRICGQWRPR